MAKLQDKVKFVDDTEKSFTATVVKVNSNGTLDIKVKRKIGNEPQIFMKVPKEIPNQKNKPKPRYIEPSTPKKQE